jgi:hypothetical protein
MTHFLVDIRQLAAEIGLSVEKTLETLRRGESQGFMHVTDLGNNRYRIVPTVPAHLYCEYLKMSGEHP